MVLLVIKSVFCFFPIPFLYLNLFFARYAKHDSASMCLHIAFHLPNKTAKDVALRWRWLQDKEKNAKKAELVEKDSSGVKVKKGQGTKGAKKNNMYPLSKDALDSKSTRELLRDSHIFMQQIEENIKTGEVCFVMPNINLYV